MTASLEDRIAAVVWGVTVSIVVAKALDLSERRFVNFVRHAWRLSEEDFTRVGREYAGADRQELPQRTERAS